MYDKKGFIAIKQGYDNLTKVEKKVADYIMQNADTIALKSVADISREAQVAKSAVIRCCQSLGFAGFSELRLSLAVELSKHKELNYIPYIDPTDTSDVIFEKIFSANIKTLHDTAEKLDRDVFKKVVDLLSEANNIYVYGIGTSSSMASDFQYRLMQLGYHASCFTDAALMKISTLNIKEGDAALAISHSGRTIATCDTLKLAGKSGAKTVSLTTYPGSEIARISDYCLCVYSDEISYPAEAISARIAHLSMLDSIAIALSARNYDETAQRSKMTHELINSIRYKK